jgi:hypothetical protein
MPELLRGPHHCVGIATSVTERIFHFLKTRAEAQSGTLSVADLGVLRQQFLASLPKATSRVWIGSTTRPVRLRRPNAFRAKPS